MVSIRIRIQLFTSIRIRIWIQGANPMRFYEAQDKRIQILVRKNSESLGRNSAKYENNPTNCI
jgi:hypothetical protein